MSELKGQPGELRATITVKRAATGKTETYELTSKISPEQAAKVIGGKLKEQDHGSHS
jgi:hypothetical protein